MADYLHLFEMDPHYEHSAVVINQGIAIFVSIVQTYSIFLLIFMFSVCLLSTIVILIIFFKMLNFVKNSYLLMMGKTISLYRLDPKLGAALLQNNTLPVLAPSTTLCIIAQPHTIFVAFPIVIIVLFQFGLCS